MNLEQVIRSLFPTPGLFINYEDYRRLIATPPEEKKPSAQTDVDYSSPPSLAPDLFAIAATLMVRSGAYHHVAPNMEASLHDRTVHFSSDELKELLDAGAEWRGEGADELPPPPAILKRLWSELWESRNQPVFQHLPGISEVPPWWRAALALLIIADEAAKGVGFWARQAASAQAATIEAPLYKDVADKKLVHTISRADKDIVSVLPKSRTPAVGCTLRSLSHNLALLPPRGLARAYWVPPGVNPAEDDLARAAAVTRPFNILMVPLPYILRASSFKGHKAENSHWGWFHIEPEWAPQTELGRSLAEDAGLGRFWEFLHSLIKDAVRDVGQVHAVVLPEAALGWSTFEAIADRLNSETGVEMFVSGLFDLASADGKTAPRSRAKPSYRLRKGNFAAMAQFSEGKEGRSYTKSVREKHHRWKLERTQIESYALGSALDPSLHWWEEITIESRSIDIFTLRGSATMTALICEDLARHDPCQELIRAIGPNLVIALLMDGAQLPQRWSGRYATVLADDPGSSVLTFTALGLLERSNDAGVLPKSRKIGLWRDDRGGVVELSLPENAHALCISLQPTNFVEYTLDGRSDHGSAQSWRLAAIRPVKGSGKGLEAILDGRWPA